MKEDILKIIEAYNKNGKLSDGEIKRLNEIAKDDPDTFNNYSSEMDSLLNDPQVQENTQRLAKSGKIESGVASGLTIAMGLVDYSTGRKQEKQGRAALASAKAPTRPRLSLKNPILNQQINNALRGRFDAEKVLAPAKQEILDNYYNDIANAKIASGGQGSTFGALAQVASQRRGRSVLQLSPIAAQAMANNNSRLDSLLGQQQADKVAQFNADKSIYDSDLSQYNQYVDSAGSLAQTGQINQRNSLNNILSSVPQIAGSIGSMKRSPQQKKVSGFGPEIDTYYNDTNDSLVNRYGNYDVFNSPYYTN